MIVDEIKYIKNKTVKLNKYRKKELKLLKKLMLLIKKIINNESKNVNSIKKKIIINHENKHYEINLSIERMNNETTKK